MTPLEDLFREFAAHFPKPAALPVMDGPFFSAEFPEGEAMFRQGNLKELPADLIRGIVSHLKSNPKASEAAYFIPRLLELWPRSELHRILFAGDVSSKLRMIRAADGESLWAKCRDHMDDRLLTALNEFRIIHIKSTGVEVLIGAPERAKALEIYMELPRIELKTFLKRWAQDPSPHRGLHFLHACSQVARSRPKRMDLLRSGKPFEQSEGDKLWVAFEPYLSQPKALSEKLKAALAVVSVPSKWSAWLYEDLRLL